MIYQYIIIFDSSSVFHQTAFLPILHQSKLILCADVMTEQKVNLKEKLYNFTRSVN